MIRSPSSPAQATAWVAPHALELARRGAAVVVNDLGVDVHGLGSGPAANVVAEEITKAGERAVCWHHCSASHKPSVLAMMSR